MKENLKSEIKHLIIFLTISLLSTLLYTLIIFFIKNLKSEGDGLIIKILCSFFTIVIIVPTMVLFVIESIKQIISIFTMKKNNHV